MATSPGYIYEYKGQLWRPCSTQSDENSFFHSAFGVRVDETERYFDRYSKFRRSRWATFLIYFENETMPPPLVDILIKCFGASDKYKHESIKDKNHYASYVTDITTAGRGIAIEEIDILSTLENIKIVLLLNGGTDPVIINPKPEILGNYPPVLEKPKEEVVLRLDGNVFSRLEPIPKDLTTQSVENNAIVVTEDEHVKERLERYEKGGSAGSKGVEFQVTLLTVLLLNSLRKLKNWKLSTENKKAGKFDDAVLEWRNRAILIQAKHKEKGKINLDQLLSTNSKNDDFSLPKYFLSYQEIKNEFKGKNNIIICTNRGVDETALGFLDSRRICAGDMLYFIDDNYSFSKFKLNILPHLREHVEKYLQKHCHYKNIDQRVITDENLQEFLESLELYSNYPLGSNKGEVTELESLVKFTGNFYNQVSFSEIYAKVMKWFQRKDGVYLNETVANGIFFEIRRDKYWQHLEQHNVLFQRNQLNFQNKTKLYYINAESGYLLQELKMYQSIRDRKSKILHISPDDNISLQQKIIEAFQLPFYKILIILWPKDVMEECGISKICDNIREILEKSEGKTVIIVAECNDKLVRHIRLDSSHYHIINETVTFEDLSEDCRERLLTENVDFQGRDISLELLLRAEANADYKNKLNPEIMRKLIKGEKIKVGQPLGQHVVHCYINRTLKRYIKGTEDEERHGRKRKEIVPEEKMFEVNDKIVVIADVAGMGKSTVLTNLAVTIKKKNPLLWIIRIDLCDYTGILDKFKERNEENISIIELLGFKDTTKLSNQLEKVIFSTKKKVVLLMDGIDEISPDYTELITRLLAQCQEEPNFAKVLVTTRPHMTRELESKLQLKPFTLRSFTEQNQINFLVGYWTHNLQLDHTCKNGCEQYAKILLNITSYRTKLYQEGEHHFAAIPLQVRMLAEVFQENEESTDWEGCKEYLERNQVWPKLPETSNVTNIYKMFIEKKRNVFRIKENPNRNTAVNLALLNQFEQCLTYHRTLALETVLGRSERELFLHYQQENENMETMILKIGIVQKSGNDFHFVHRTFAEYFVAKSLEVKFQEQNQSLEFQKFFFDEILLNAKFRVVRTFFDNFLQQTVDSLPSSFFQNYQSLKYDVDLTANSMLIHQLATEGCVAILHLLLKCINFKKVTIVEIDINDHFRHYLRTFKIPARVSSNTLNVLQILLEPAGINIKDEIGQTPLCCASQQGHLEMVRFLVDNDANLDTVTLIKQTAIHLALHNNHVDIVKFLVQQGANIETKDSLGHTILYNAISRNLVDMVTCLFDRYLEIYGVNEKYPIIPYTIAYLGQLNLLEDLMNKDLNINTTVENGETLIFGAARGGQAATIEYLIQRDADINSTDDDGNTVLHLISMNSMSISTVKALVKLEIDVNVRNFRGHTPLHFAVNVLEMTKLLVESGANVNSKDANGATALYPAASRGQFESVKFLLERGADIYVTDNGGNTVLHSAAGGKIGIVRFLLEHGMDVNIKNTRGDLPLHRAVSSGELEIVGLLVEYGVDVNTGAALGNSAIYLAALGQNRHMVEYLVQHGGDVNITNTDGFTVLHIAARNANLDAVKSLVEVGADINLKNDDNCTALHLSALNSKWDTVRFLLECDKNLNMKERYHKMILKLASHHKNVFYPYGQGSLHAAALTGEMDIVELLLQLGVSINIKDDNGCTPLQFAARYQLNIVKILIEHGADINAKDNRGCSALHEAAYGGQGDIVIFLLKSGVNVNMADDEGCTVLHYAACSGHWDMVEFFLELGINVNIKNNYGRVPMQFAASNRSSNVLKSFFYRGGDPNNRDDDGCTALHLAASRGHFDAVKFLTGLSADISVRDNCGRTILHFAVSNYFFDTVNFFICLGIDVNITDNYSRTALHYAVLNNNLNAVKFLTENNSDLNIKDKDGNTALHLAVKLNQLPVAEYLIAFVSDVNTKNNSGSTALHLASKNGNLKLVKYLVERGGDVHITDNDGRTVLHFAALQDSTNGLAHYGSTDNKRKAHWSVVRFLVQRGADVNHRNSMGETAAMLAERSGNFHLLQYLE